MKPSLRFFLALTGLLAAAQLFGQSTTQNNTLQGRVLYQSSGNKPAVGVQVKEKDSNGDYSKDKGEYRLIFQKKRNGEVLAIEISPDTREGKKIELVNEKEVKAAKLPASAEEVLDIIVCLAGQRDIAAQKYYRILRTTADRELEKKRKEVEGLLAQKEKDYQKISDLFAQLDGMQAALDSAKIREQAFSIASINLDRASQMVKDAVRKIEEENDVEGALMILNTEALDTAYQRASALKKKADAAIQQVIEGYEFRISLLEPQFKYGEIAECYEKIAGIYERESYNEADLATYLAEAANNWELYSDYKKQLEFNLKSLYIREKILPADHPDLADSYNNMSMNYGNLGEHQKQLEFNLKSLYIREKILPADHPDLANSYGNLAVTYTYLGEYQKALEFNLKALSISEKILPSNNLDMGVFYNNFAATYNFLGNYQKALEFSLKSLAIFEKLLPSQHPNLAASYNNIGMYYYNFGEYRKALEYLFKGLSINEESLPADHLNIGKSYENIAGSFNSLGEQQKALEFYLKSQDIYEKNLSSDHPLIAQLYQNIALVFHDLSEQQKALEFYCKALSIYIKVLPPDHPNLAILYNNMGRTYRDAKEYKKSIEYSQKAIHIGEASSPKHRYLNRFYRNIGITYVKTRNFSKAKAAFEKSESLKAEEGVHRGWARYYALQKKKKQALESLQKAVALGFKDLKWLETEPDLKNIRKEQAYKDLVEQLKNQ